MERSTNEQVIGDPYLLSHFFLFTFSALYIISCPRVIRVTNGLRPVYIQVLLCKQEAVTVKLSTDRLRHTRQVRSLIPNIKHRQSIKTIHCHHAQLIEICCRRIRHYRIIQIIHHLIELLTPKNTQKRSERNATDSTLNGLKLLLFVED